MHNRYIFQAFAVNELHGQVYQVVSAPGVDTATYVTGDDLLAAQTWSYNQLWWYCFTAILIIFAVVETAKLLATRYVCFLKR